MSEPPYRAGGATGRSSLVLRFVCVDSWTRLGALLILVSGFVWVISTQTADTSLHTALGALAFLAMVSFTMFPLVTVRARVEAGHLVVSGRRWPGAETVWSCTRRMPRSGRTVGSSLASMPGSRRTRRASSPLKNGPSPTPAASWRPRREEGAGFCP